MNRHEFKLLTIEHIVNGFLPGDCAGVDLPDRLRAVRGL